MTKPRTAMTVSALDKVFPFLLKYQAKHKGLSPSLREVGKQFGKSGEWARLCFKELEKLNMVTVDYYKQRGVVVINK